MLSATVSSLHLDKMTYVAAVVLLMILLDEPLHIVQQILFSAKTREFAILHEQCGVVQDAFSEPVEVRIIQRVGRNIIVDASIHQLLKVISK